MNAEQWALHDKLRVSFAKILFAWQHPIVLSDPIDDGLHDQRLRQMQQYFNSDPAAHHVLRALVHAAVEATKK